MSLSLLPLPELEPWLSEEGLSEMRVKLDSLVLSSLYPLMISPSLAPNGGSMLGRETGEETGVVRLATSNSTMRFWLFWMISSKLRVSK